MDCHALRMTKQLTVRLPDELADWLDQAESKTDTVIAALRRAHRDELNQKILAEYERVPADTEDDWGDPTEFSEANRRITWGDNEG